jgi:hypothetical protein
MDAFKIVTDKHKGKRPLGRPRSSLHMRMDLKEIDVSTRNWIHLAYGKDYWTTLVNAGLNLRVL